MKEDFEYIEVRMSKRTYYLLVGCLAQLGLNYDKLMEVKKNNQKH